MKECHEKRSKGYFAYDSRPVCTFSLAICPPRRCVIRYLQNDHIEGNGGGLCLGQSACFREGRRQGREWQHGALEYRSLESGNPGEQRLEQEYIQARGRSRN